MCLRILILYFYVFYNLVLNFVYFRILIPNFYACLNFHTLWNFNIEFARILKFSPLIIPMRAMHTQIRLIELYPYDLKDALRIES
jgi:hypothetical protein